MAFRYSNILLFKVYNFKQRFGHENHPNKRMSEEGEISCPNHRLNKRIVQEGREAAKEFLFCPPIRSQGTLSILENCCNVNESKRVVLKYNFQE